MERTLPISDDDIRSIVCILGDVAGSTEPLLHRRKQLMDGIIKLVDADTWMWLATRDMGDGKPTAFFIMDGGWIDDAERTRLWHLNSMPEVLMPIFEGTDLSRHSTFYYDEHRPGWQNGTVIERYLRPAGFEHLLLSFYPLGSQTMSAMGVHRRVGRPPFTPRDTAIVHLITSQIDWLHREGTNIPANNPALSTLSPRQREVLVHLLSGNSRKQVARKLGLSEHTVGDHIKGVYTRLGVSSNTELLALFLPQS